MWPLPGNKKEPASGHLGMQPLGVRLRVDDRIVGTRHQRERDLQFAVALGQVALRSESSAPHPPRSHGSALAAPSSRSTRSRRSRPAPRSARTSSEQPGRSSPGSSGRSRCSAARRRGPAVRPAPSASRRCGRSDSDSRRAAPRRRSARAGRAPSPSRPGCPSNARPAPAARRRSGRAPPGSQRPARPGSQTRSRGRVLWPKPGRSKAITRCVPASSANDAARLEVLERHGVAVDQHDRAAAAALEAVQPHARLDLDQAAARRVVALGPARLPFDPGGGERGRDGAEDEQLGA